MYPWCILCLKPLQTKSIFLKSTLTPDNNFNTSRTLIGILKTILKSLIFLLYFDRRIFPFQQFFHENYKFLIFKICKCWIANNRIYDIYIYIIYNTKNMVWSMQRKYIYELKDRLVFLNEPMEVIKLLSGV